MSHTAALPILNCLKNELNGDVATLSNTKLGKLLQWMGIPVSKMGKHAEWEGTTNELWRRAGTIWMGWLLVRHGLMPTRKSLKLLRTIPLK